MIVDRIHDGPLYADIVPDRHKTDVWFYVVQRGNSPEILAMGNALSEESARQLARRAMRLVSAAAVTRRSA